MPHAGHDLMQHDVHAAHVLPLLAAEVMARAAAKPRMGVHVFNDVADVFDAARTAPVAQLPHEAVAIAARDQIHVRQADCSRRLAHVVPQRR